jgi:hypothetical protein
MVERGIVVHLLFMSTPGGAYELLMPIWEDLVSATGGSLTFVDTPAELTQTVEHLYFERFQYNTSVTTIINTANVSQDVQLSLPAFELDRLRIYVSAALPIPGVQFRADGAQVSFMETRAHAVFELGGQIPRTVSLTLPPNDNSEIHIYTIADGSLTLGAYVECVAVRPYIRELPVYYYHSSTVQLVTDRDIHGIIGEDFAAHIIKTDPNGQTTTVTGASFAGNAFSFSFYPQYFVEYTFLLSLESFGIGLFA